jgi:hypothetical protein
MDEQEREFCEIEYRAMLEHPELRADFRRKMREVRCRFGDPDVEMSDEMLVAAIEANLERLTRDSD